MVIKNAENNNLLALALVLIFAKPAMVIHDIEKGL